MVSGVSLQKRNMVSFRSACGGHRWRGGGGSHRLDCKKMGRWKWRRWVARKSNPIEKTHLLIMNNDSWSFSLIISSPKQHQHGTSIGALGCQTKFAIKIPNHAFKVEVFLTGFYSNCLIQEGKHFEHGLLRGIINLFPIANRRRFIQFLIEFLFSFQLINLVAPSKYGCRRDGEGDGGEMVKVMVARCQFTKRKPLAPISAFTTSNGEG
ncbi:hypothetical protein L1987_42601 [Smallanthus sonchifolius]|uniref:Uncharacterized protein n=1 Tax=Smallanthus sonchifolius TaxID=185202 RepID=A0ACB9GJ77_9ASTR|nr:hypothetical protein L1987_42601 [Smallanthus sonchifolius]